MSIQTYAELQAAVASWTHRSDLTAIIPDLITIAEKRIFREVRVRVMETAFSGTIANGVIAVPADYLEFKFAYAVISSASRQLSGASASQIYAKYPNRVSAGPPCMIAREGANFIFGPYPDSAYAVSGIYYAKPVAIATTANALFLANPDLYLFAALSEAAPYAKDAPGVQLWEAKYASIKQQMAFEDSSESGSAGTMSIKAA